MKGVFIFPLDVSRSLNFRVKFNKKLKIAPQFFAHRKQYVMQSGYSAISIFIITFLLNNNPVVIASIGSTAFIVFSMSNSITAQPRRIIGGHLVGFFVGTCFAVFPFMHITFLRRCGMHDPLE